MNADPATPLPECIEGPEAFRRFNEGMDQLLSVSHTTLVRRERAYRKQVDANPHRRGPKRKVKSSASPGPAA